MKSAEHIVLGVVTLLLVGTSSVLGWLLWNRGQLEARFEEAHPIAEALQGELEEESGAWPPMVGATVMTDAGADTGEDVGPEALLPEPLDTPGYIAREGERDGIRYIEVVVGDAQFDDVLPMLVMIHGRGGRAMIPGGPFLGLSYPVRIIVPQAPEPLGQGFQWLPVYVGQGLVDRLSSTLFQTASRLASVLRALREERPTIGKVIVSGFSQGALITLALAIHHDDLVGHAFPLASWMPPPLVPAYRRPDLSYPRVRSMHGTADTTIPLGPTRQLFAQLSDMGFDVELVEFEGVEHVISEDENTLFHHWLNAAVCTTLGDVECAVEAEMQAAIVRQIELPDAGFGFPDANDDAGDVGPIPPDAGEDAGDDAGEDAGQDAGEDAPDLDDAAEPVI